MKHKAKDQHPMKLFIYTIQGILKYVSRSYGEDGLLFWITCHYISAHKTKSWLGFLWINNHPKKNESLGALNVKIPSLHVLFSIGNLTELCFLSFLKKPVCPYVFQDSYPPAYSLRLFFLFSCIIQFCSGSLYSIPVCYAPF